MNKRNIITSALLAMLALVGCQRNDDLGGLRRPVHITATIEAQGAETRAQLNSDGSGSLNDGDEISLWHSTNSNPPTMLDYTFGTTKLYWEDVITDSYNVIHFGGWYPKYRPEGTLSEPKDYDVAGAADEAKRDLLIAPLTEVKHGKPVSLAFRHVMHKLAVNLESDKHTAEQLASAKITPCLPHSHARVDFLAGKVEEAEASGNTAYPPATGASVFFVVAPQDLEAGREMLRIEIGEKTFFFPVPETIPGNDPSSDASRRLLSGKRLLLTLSIGEDDAVTLETGNISAWDDGGSSSGTATGDNGGGTVEEQFPDPNFKAYVLENFDTDKDGKISAEEASKVTQIRVSKKEIKDLKGIEIFIRLQELVCNNNRLTALDLSENTELQELNCSSNRLTELDLSKNTRLQGLWCANNQLAALNISKSTELQRLLCSYNQLTALDLSKNARLQTLSCDNNQLTALDLTENAGLQTLACDNNQLTALDLSKNTKLDLLTCPGNRLTALDVSKNTVLRTLRCGNQQDGRLLQLTLGNAHNRKKWKEQWKEKNHPVTAKDE